MFTWSQHTSAALSLHSSDRYSTQVPHTHDDTGWQVTVDQYFVKEVFFVIDTVIQNLRDNADRKFIYVEIGFFARWCVSVLVTVSVCVLLHMRVHLFVRV